ncbi:MAG: phosphatidylcholine/phosphatidylserine synthase [Gammaproteobacteria bacterium]|nr:phosphatidylcholine/phosphatidylserine synthase [Gammaproteobacteria bacterium]NNF60268.1 phosphatidylcholine/phosphatidylserine synthase [Gammaproteobacteria bacterium]NNM20376.1 phosphatidylcholine/phosphatidylserine synthase [Gammaproteobacteria bacterium]
MAVNPVKKRSLSRRGIYLLPNLLTTAALFAGFYAAIAAIDGAFMRAAIAIFVAMVLDGVDGRVARLTGTDSDFGKEYDSLCDMVSFGLAPALVVYQWGLQNIGDSTLAWSKLGWLAAFFYAVAAALRLARFNSRPAADKRFFEGLPSPSGAGLVGGWVWLGTQYQLAGTYALIPAFLVTAAAGILMVSSLRYYSFKEFNLGERIPFTQVILIPAVFMLISLNPPVVLFGMFAGFALTGPLYALYRLMRRRRRKASDDVTPGADEGDGSPRDKTA